MFIRTTRVKRGGKVYEYPQLVESYRREDGRPTHRVVASLKGLSPEAVQAIRVGLAAARKGETVVPVAKVVVQAEDRHQVVANLGYLPLAMFDAIWEAWELGSLLDDLLPSSSIASHGLVVEALTLHRCVDPDSKLAASRWYPTTALPELLGVKPRYFNNSRVHRALEVLGEVETPLQDALAARIHAESNGAVATYLDLTDTWFVGRGPDLSQRGKTKEGLLREKIGIALLCDQRGFPLRWKTVQGGRYEPSVMLELLGEAREAGALRGQPVVMDRAMGRGAHLVALAEAEVPYVTSLVRCQFATFVPDGPWDAFVDMELSGSTRTRERDLARLAEVAIAAGLEPAGGGRFVKDFGVARCELPTLEPPVTGHGPVAELLQEAEFMDEALRLGWATSVTALAKWYGCTRHTLAGYLKLLDLGTAVRRRILRGEAERLTLQELRAIAAEIEDEQERAFDDKLALVRSQERPRPIPAKILDPDRCHLVTRRALVFLPQRLLDHRNAVRRRTKALGELVDTLNREQRVRKKPLPPENLLAAMRAFLDRHSWVDLFAVSTLARRHRGRMHHEVVIERDEAEWRRRRSLDGYSVVVAHPALTHTAEDLVRLYASKDVVEKDFRIIKSELDLRPIRHRTDPKVRAHVTLCMLALLLQRAAEQRMAVHNAPRTAASAIEALETCHLNRVTSEHVPPYHTVTAPTQEQRDVLRSLDLEHLVDDAKVNERIEPR
jgi:hypothetical protein